MEIKEEDVLKKIEELEEFIDDLSGSVSDVEKTLNCLEELKEMFTEEEKED